MNLYKRLLKYLAPHKSRFFIASICMVVVSGFGRRGGDDY